MLSRVYGVQLNAGDCHLAVLDAQISLRNNRRLQAAMRSSRLPAVKLLSDFDFSFQPVKGEQIENLARAGFVKREGERRLPPTTRSR